MRAASIAIAYEVPKLLATAIVNEASFPELLERRLRHFEQMKLIEAKPTQPKVTEVTEVISSNSNSTNGNGSGLAAIPPFPRPGRRRL